MSDNAFSALASDYAAALDWWREAGVDLDFTDEPTAWLRAPEEAAAAEAPVEAATPAALAPRPPRTGDAPALERALARAQEGRAGITIGGDPAHWPQDLPAFRAFWLTEPTLDPGALAERVAPEGAAGAALMVLVGQPEPGDREALMSGACGALLGRILRAMGLAEDAIYLASALPRCSPAADWDDLATRGLAALTRHHIALAAPRRLIAFGGKPAQLAEDCGVPMLAAPQLGTLMRSAALKRRFWHEWLEWSA